MGRIPCVERRGVIKDRRCNWSDDCLIVNLAGNSRFPGAYHIRIQAVRLQWLYLCSKLLFTTIPSSRVDDASL